MWKREEIQKVLLALVCASLMGCAAALPLASSVASGGVTLYKSAKESGPKVEVVLFKFSHDQFTNNYVQPPKVAPVAKKSQGRIQQVKTKVVTRYKEWWEQPTWWHPPLKADE